MAAGACPCPLEPRRAVEETARRVSAVGLAWMLHDVANAATAEACGLPPARLLAASDIEQGPVDWAGSDVAAADPGLLLFTSGSTGNPKGVLLSHRGLANNARGVLAHTGLTPEDRLLHVMPLHHTNALNNQIFTPLLAGASVALADGRIAAIGALPGAQARHIIDGTDLALAPGFIDVHTHDDTNVIRTPGMLPKLSQGVTTVVVGNCGISASPVSLRAEPPDPMNLLGGREDFNYPTFADYTRAIEAAQPAVNVAALVGHTALRSNHMDRLDRAAPQDEVLAMREQLRDALAHGAIGLSTGLAYASAFEADTAEWWCRT
ncbi:hypothetical protein G6F65_017104 [Rhizopus arrhizus]|nr:hypothetical protein G6F65_017104 [Rhizopus arrhizus]